MKYITPFKKMYEKWYLTLLCLAIIFLSMFFIGVISVRYSLHLAELTLTNQMFDSGLQQQVMSTMQNMFLFMLLIFIFNEGFLWTLGERIMHRKLSFYNSWFRWLIITIVTALFVLLFSVFAYMGLNMIIYYLLLLLVGYFAIIAYSSIHHRWPGIWKSIFKVGFKKFYIALPFYLIPAWFFYYFGGWMMTISNAFASVFLLVFLGVVYLLIRLYWIYLYGEILA